MDAARPLKAERQFGYEAVLALDDAEAVRPKLVSNGGGGIRTHGALARPSVFKTDPFDRSGTPPARIVTDGYETRTSAGAPYRVSTSGTPPWKFSRIARSARSVTIVPFSVCGFSRPLSER